MPHYVVDAVQSICTWRTRCNTAVGTFGWTMTILHLPSVLCKISVVSTLKGGARQHCYQYSGLHRDELQEVVDMQGQLRRDIARTSCVPPKKPSAMSQVCILRVPVHIKGFNIYCSQGMSHAMVCQQKPFALHVHMRGKPLLATSMASLAAAVYLPCTLIAADCDAILKPSASKYSHLATRDAGQLH